MNRPFCSTSRNAGCKGIFGLYLLMRPSYMVFQLFLVKPHLVLVSIKHDWAIHLCYLSPIFYRIIYHLNCWISSEPLLVLIEYVPFGDLLGYLRTSRGLNDTYYKDPDIKLQKIIMYDREAYRFGRIILWYNVISINDYGCEEWSYSYHLV